MSSTLTDNQAKKNIAANLRARMDLLGLSQADIARAIGTNPMTICHYVNAQRMPGAAVLARVASVLGVTIDDMLAPPKKKSRRRS